MAALLLCRKIVATTVSVSHLTLVTSVRSSGLVTELRNSPSCSPAMMSTTALHTVRTGALHSLCRSCGRSYCVRLY